MSLDSKQPLPDIVAAEVKEQTRIAAALRESPAMTAVESLLALEAGSGPGIFDDAVARRYVRARFGEDALNEYLKRITDAGDLLPVVAKGGWKASPLSVGLSLGTSVFGGGEKFAYSRMGRLISQRVVDAVTGRGKKRICVTAPYRHGKSAMSSIVTPAFMLANFPHTVSGLCTHSDSLSQKFSRLLRNAVLSNPGKFGFGLADDSQAVSDWSTTAGGGCWQGSVGSFIQGRGISGCLCIDDLFGSEDDSRSKASRDRVWEWMMSSALTRLNSTDCVVLLVTTRWWSDDCVGRLQSGADETDPDLWDFVNLPAIATEDDDDLGRRKGEALWPERHSLDSLLDMQKSMSRAAFSRGYQQICLDDIGLNRAYHAFDPAKHVRPCPWVPEHGRVNELHCGTDANVTPMSATILSISSLEPKSRHPMMTDTHWASVIGAAGVRYDVRALEEISLENSNAVELAEAIANRVRRLARGFPCKLHLYGDSSMANRSAASALANDSTWKILIRELQRAGDGYFSVYPHRESRNPGVGARCDLTNMLLETGQLVISDKCRMLAKDFREVCWKVGKDGSKDVIDKTSNPNLTHASDSATYALWSRCKGATSGRFGEIAESPFGIFVR